MNDTLSPAPMRRFFESGETRPVSFRLDQLKRLRAVLLEQEEPLYDALATDLKKSKEEAWITETGMVLSELNHTIRRLKSWTRPKQKASNLLNWPSSCWVESEPLGVVLIIGPWNYPLMLLFTPLIGAIAAGNCAVLKGSEFAPATSELMKKMITENFSDNYLRYIDGDGAMVVPALIHQFRFDHIFFTGSTATGKKIYQQASEQLIPVTLELGGKSPALIAEDAAIISTARRIAGTKFSNTGQMCVAPDYLLVPRAQQEQWVAALKKQIRLFFGEKPEDSDEYGKIINEKQFDRLTGYLSQGCIVHGGQTDRERLFIAPTLLTEVTMDMPVMQDEIFGPVLPILTYRSEEEALDIIRQHPDPLAFYVFTQSNKTAAYWLRQVPSGSACINNASLHLTNPHLPFGGRGNSGLGRYHGIYSFEAFSHSKAVMKTPAWFDPRQKYPPFKGKLKLLKMIFGK